MGPHAWNAFPNTVNFSLFKWYLKISDRTHVPSGIYLNILKSVSSTLYTVNTMDIIFPAIQTIFKGKLYQAYFQN